MKLSPHRLLRFYRNLPIRSKLVLVLYVQILIPLILVGYLSYTNSEGIIKDKSAAYSRDILNMIQMRLGDYVKNLTIISQDLLYEEKIYDILKNKITNQINRFEDANVVNSHLKMVILSRTEIRAISIIGNNGTSCYADDNSSYVSDWSSLPYDDIREKARLRDGMPIWYVVSEDRKVRDVFICRIINDIDSYKEIGLMLVQVKKEFLDTIYQGLTGNLDNIAILTGDNELIACRNINDTYLFSDELTAGMIGEKGEREDKETGNFVSYNSMKDPDWKVVAYITLDELYRDAYVLRRNIILLCFVSVVLLSLISAFIAVDFVKPINNLVKGMKKVQKGESGVSVKDDREDELGFLNKTFNEMSGEIHHLVNWVYREQLTRREAELKALQSRINPHFLFNTLESINWLAQLNNVPEISSTVSDLSDLMEAGIGRDDRLISIEEEFSYADKYISLLKRRFEDRIELEKNVQNGVLDIKIPRLLIQPLIENAVFHGIEKSRGKGIIKLNAYKSGGNVIIEVIDNGAGMDREELECLNERLSLDNDSYFKKLAGRRNKSVGIENVNRRIKLFYGENYGLLIKSEPGQYTRAVVTIPAKESRAAEGFYVQGNDN